MNEQIIEMAIKAGFNPVNCTGSNVPLFEKFAELIIKECAIIATINQFQWDSTGGYVLKHFGIE